MNEPKMLLCPECGKFEEQYESSICSCPFCGTKMVLTNLSPFDFNKMGWMQRHDYTCTPEVKELIGGWFNVETKTKREKYEASQFQSSPPQVKCPKCGSTQIQIKKRGWKVTTGFLGSSKNERVCVNCLYKF